ncbi:MAG: phosphatidylserine decarboxylase [Lachnospiraceae bacterium]|nr:phosphatidylserine decarboxylase [Lachnospiraceae bacterium]
MRCRDRAGNEINENNMQDKVLSVLYGTKMGRALLGVLVKPAVSKLAGLFLDSAASKFLISPFIKRTGIDMSEYIETNYRSYNDFFTRRIKSACRVADMTPEHLISPCDGKLSVFPISDDSIFTVKNTGYTLDTLFRNKKLARHYRGGTLLMFRLCVNDLHRYRFIDNGIKTKTHHIKGIFHTVNPTASDYYPIYKENTREFCILKSENFGNVLTMEVGAMFVGKIINYSAKKEVKRGEEKGRFEFGGSTIILCLEKNTAIIDEDIIANSTEGIETIVKSGEKIGIAM